MLEAVAGVEALLLLSALGGLLGLDQTSVGQTMVSRPLVAATLAGAVLGEPATGAAVGVVLELFHLVVLPVGGARFPEPGPAACGGASAAVALPGPEGLAAGVALGLVWAHLGGATVTLLRKWNGRRVPDPTADRVTAAAVRRGHWGAISVDFVRGAAVAGTGAAVGLLVVPAWSGGWPLDARATAGLLATAAAFPVGAFLRMFGGWRRHRWIVAGGAAVGLALVAVA